ncbi:hypothetical protein SAMN05216574_1096 [Blastococcus tunisiensis]|uniref:HNH endonuclease n=1 Tax=Blastococcus tunisiensis TaxID=1798228 RepID=A0A1I2G439_9ACTN|nr:hypothetical protein SAMN05216574_1096 [Blastococcus sp. DSM 46838]
MQDDLDRRTGGQTSVIRTVLSDTAGSNSAVEEKQCLHCLERKPVTEFYWDEKRQRYKAWCRPCENAVKGERRRQRSAQITPAERAAENQKQYARDARKKEAIGEDAWRSYRTGLHTAYVEQNRANLWQYLEDHPCVDCGETDIVVLQFDHRDRESKEVNVSQMIYSYSWRSILREIDKCDVVCVNDHMRRTARQLNWKKALLAEVPITSVADVDAV